MLDYLIIHSTARTGQRNETWDLYQGVNAQDAVNKCRKDHELDTSFKIEAVKEDSGSDWVDTWEKWT